MLSKRTEGDRRLTSALTGMTLAVGIAREATDAVPIVKQCLGSAVRIIAFAEKIDKDRQALRELADKSLQLARRVKDIMAARTPDAKVETSLERILRALESIEAFMGKHSARSCVYRLIGYAFTVPQHVGRLSRELADAVQELIVVALLDVDHHVHATSTAVDENARFVGEFRLLRHCEVQKLDRIFDYEDREDSNAAVRYHRAQIDGQLLVVRYFAGGIPQQSPSGQTHDETMFNRITFHDSILEEISSVQRSHRNVARIYGWSRGSVHERFIVFKSGFHHLYSVLHQMHNPLITVIHWVYSAFGLIWETAWSDALSGIAIASQDAVHHLRLQGIIWKPPHPGPYKPDDEFRPMCPYALDDQLQPMIGLQNDLDRMDQVMDLPFVAYDQIFNMTYPLWPFSERKCVPAATLQKLIAGCSTERLANLIGKAEVIPRRRHTIHTAEFSSRRILSDNAAERLIRILEDEAFDDGWRDESWTWVKILLALDKNRSHPLMRTLRVVYYAHRRGEDQICLYGIDQEQECIVYDTYTFYVPHDQQDEIREMLGIPAPSERRFTDHLVATGPYCMLE